MSAWMIASRQMFMLDMQSCTGQLSDSCKLALICVSMIDDRCICRQLWETVHWGGGGGGGDII